MNRASLDTTLQSLESGARPKGGVTADSGEIPSLGGEHVNSDGGFDFTNVKRIPRCFFQSMRGGRIAVGDILVVKDGATTGKTSLVRDDFPFAEAAVNEHVFCLRVDERKALPSYVFHFLFSPRGQKAIQLDFRGATVGGISREFASKVILPLPPLAEQRRIAEVLDEADALRFKRRAALTKLETLYHAMFLEMFGDPSANQKGWRRKPIASFGSVITGNTPSRAIPDYFGVEIEWIKSDNINTADHFLTRAEEGLSAKGKAVARIAPAGAILVTCIAGSPDCIGNAAMTDREVAFNQQINALLPNSGNGHFLYGQLVVGKRLIQQASTSGMKGMVSKSRFEKILLMDPPIHLQHAFAIRAVCIERLARLYRASLDDLDALFTSIQDGAFRVRMRE